MGNQQWFASPRSASMKRVLVLMLVLTIGAVSGISAQIASGNIYGTAVDEQGGVLPGVEVTLLATSIGGSPRTAVSDSQGQFRFLNLDPGTYKLTLNLAGFTKAERDVIVNTGVNVNVSFTLRVSAIQENVTVTAASPVVDIKKVGTATTMTKEDLTSQLQSKDPWSM